MSKSNIITILLIAAILLSSFYTYTNFRHNKGEIIIQISDIFSTLALPYRIASLTAMSPGQTIKVPVHGVRARDVDDTYGAPRAGGRTHNGIDIFAVRGTPVYVATKGFVLRVGQSNLGGNYVWTIGPGGRRYYYAHLDSIVSEIKFGTPVTTDTVIGYVGNTGNASTTPPHLHFEIRIPGEGVSNPYGLLE